MALGIALFLAGPAAAQVYGEGATSSADDTLSDTRLRGELKRFVHDEAKATLHVRSYFLDKVNPKPPYYVALAAGGWVGLESGWLYDTFQVGVVGYTSQPVWAPNNSYETAGPTSLLSPHGTGFSVLGQAYASVRWKGQTFTGYRQHVDELEVNPWDNRELPQTFEAYALRGRLGEIDYFAGYVAAVKPRNHDAFINMGEAAGAPNVNAGMALASVKYGNPKALMLRSSFYYVPDILWSNYNDAAGTIALNDQLTVRLYGQFMVQGSNGLHLLTGKPFGTFTAGAKVDTTWGPFMLTGAVMQTGSANQYLTPYGIFIGYNKQQVLDFDRAGERSYQIGLTYDFAAVGLPGTSLLANVVYGANAIDPATGAALAETYEYNLDLKIAAGKLAVPDWLKPLQLRGRISFIDHYLAGAVSSTTEYRAVLNYEVSWQGPRRR